MNFPPIAIVGRGCVLPGALSPTTLQELVAERKSALEPARAADWRLGDHVDRSLLALEIASDVGGYVRNFDRVYDPQGFRIPAGELATLDPLVHWSLHAAREALREAGCNTGDEDLRRGLVMGNLSYPTQSLNKYALEVWKGERTSSNIDPRNRFMSGLPAQLVAQALGLGQGGFALDAACASSLYAIEIACRRLHQRTADLMLAGGANHVDDLFLHLGFTALKALSPSGQSRPFHRDADGLIPAHGAAFVALKRLEDAQAANDRILGVIRGVGLSNDGRSKGLLAPSEDGQQRAMRAAYGMSGLTPDDISFIECHATGTAVGDAVELRSMKRIFDRAHELPVGSLKSNLGHLITASGAASVLKMIAAMETGLLPPTLHATELNSEFDDGRFRVLRESEPWLSKGPRRAAINNFGFGGNNAHLILEQWLPPSNGRSFRPSSPPRRHETQEIAIIAQHVRAAGVANQDEFATAILRQRTEAALEVAPWEQIAIDVRSVPVPPLDLASVLPQQLAMLQAAGHLEFAIRKLPAERTALIVGMQCDAEIARIAVRFRQPLAADSTAQYTGPVTPSIVLGCMPNMLANRLSFQFGLHGPCFTVAAEEASGTVALQLANDMLANGVVDAVLVAAVDLSQEPVQRAAAQATLAEQQHVPGDAVVLMILKRRDCAVRDGDDILAILDAGDPSAENRWLLNASDLAIAQQVGHSHSASGLLQVAAAITACRHRVLPGTRQHPAVPWLPQAGQRRAAIAVAALGGYRTTTHVRGELGTGCGTDCQTPAGVLLPHIACFAGESMSELIRAMDANDSLSDGPLRLAVVANSNAQLRQRILDVRPTLERHRPGAAFEMGPGIHFREQPLTGELAFVFTGPSGAYSQMGRDVALMFPELVDGLASDFPSLRQRVGWIYDHGSDYEAGPQEQLWASSFLTQLHAAVTRKVLGMRPQASIGYSSGETNALFAFGAWEGFESLARDIETAGVYTRELAGEFQCARLAWKLAPHETAQWSSYRLLAPVDTVRAAVAEEPRVHLTIINCDSDVIIAGDAEGCRRVVQKVAPRTQQPLAYNMIMHCPEAQVFGAAWRTLHHRPTRRVSGVRFYSHASNGHFTLGDDTVADALLGQAMSRIDFRELVRNAYSDGVRIFVEHGPLAGCTNWINSILEGQEHLAVPLDRYGCSSLFQVANAAATLFASGVPIQLREFHHRLHLPARTDMSQIKSGKQSRTMTFAAHWPPLSVPGDVADDQASEFMEPAPRLPLASRVADPVKVEPDPVAVPDAPQAPPKAVPSNFSPGRSSLTKTTAPAPRPCGPAFNREQLIVHASGRISEIYGDLFQRQDGFARQVRIPEPPLLLIDRVTGLTGEPGTMGRGTVWTETDVRDDSWFIHEGRMPAGIMIEAGQADMLLISWLGADFHNKGQRIYRLLGCELTMYGPLPKLGDTLCYDIHVEGHAQHGETRLFFFRYDCRINGEVRLSVRNGQAGFFTDEQLAASEGVLWDPTDGPPTVDARLDKAPVPCGKRSLSREDIDHFAHGRADKCFGSGFERGATHTRSPRIQADRMRLIDEVSDFDPAGGPWGRGYLRAVLHLRPDDWFLTCHFLNDPCMPGTLMLEGSLQAMSVYLAAIGCTLNRDGWRFEVVEHETFKVSCRGQATPSSQELVYEIFVDEFIDGPEPILFAAILGTVDGHKAFYCPRIGLRLVPGWPLEPGRQQIAIPKDQRTVAHVEGFAFDYASLLACAWGRPSTAFGDLYKPFDDTRRMARLPGPPYHFITRVAQVDGPCGGMRLGTRADVEYDVPRDAWYFAENGSSVMPFTILLEVALQPCGWLAAYVGCAASRKEDLCFRNLDGTSGTVHAEVTPDIGTLTTTAHLESLSSVGAMILCGFDVTVKAGETLVYSTKTVFGFFPEPMMKDQVGLPTSEQQRAALREPAAEMPSSRRRSGTPSLATERLLAVDRVTGYWPTGGRAGLGRLRAEKSISPDQWFFKAHFFQDPVQPGSIGLEAMLQALQRLVIEQQAADGMVASQLETPMVGVPMSWKYRGQVVPENKTVVVDVEITESGTDSCGLYALAQGSLWVDGKRIYEASGLSVRLVPLTDHTAASGKYAGVAAGTRGTEVSPPLVEASLRSAEIPSAPATISTVGQDELHAASVPDTTRQSSVGAWRGWLFPLGFGDIDTVSAWLGRLHDAVTANQPLDQLSRECLDAYAASEACPHAVVLLAGSPPELLREVTHCRQTLPRTLEQGETWRTPGGSYGTLRPLGRDGVAFIYPGIGSVYQGFARHWPSWSPAVASEVAEQFGPDSVGTALAQLTPTDAEEDWTGMTRSLLERPGELVQVGLTLAYAQTALLRLALGLRPRWALGYSMGEAAMYGCLGFYPAPGPALRRLCAAEVWRSGLAGSMTLVRRQWGLPPAQPGERPPWESQAFALTRREVEPLLVGEPRVFLTHVNAPRELVLSGEPAALRRLGERLPVVGTPMPLALALHCEMTRAAQAELLGLTPEERQPCPGLTFYSSAYNTAVPHHARTVARAVVECFCRPVDFPALVEAAYAGGARVFVEVGPRRICSSWVEATLAGREHAVVPLDNKGTTDAASWSRALARLLAHRVKLDASALLPPGDGGDKALCGEKTGSEPAKKNLRQGSESEDELRKWLEQHLKDLLGLAVPPDPEMTFFELGLDSLMAFELRNRLQTRVGDQQPLPGNVAFEYPTVQRLARYLSQRRQQSMSGTNSTLPLLRVSERPRCLPLSYSQQRLWFLNQWQPDSAFYNIPVAVRLRGKLDVEALRQALEVVTQRHEILRTRLPAEGGVAYQEIAPALPLRLPVEDLGGLSPMQRRERLEQTLREEAEGTFDLAEGPLWRVRLLRLQEQEHALLLCWHHIIIDGWSMGVIAAELSQGYAAACAGGPIVLPPLAVQYVDYTLWQRECLQGETRQRQLSYWREQLAGLMPLELPLDHARPARISHRGGSIPVRLSVELTHHLRELARQENVTLFMVVLAGWQTLLARYSGQNDVAVGCPIAGRTEEGLEGLLGLFVNTLVLRSRVKRSQTVRELLRAVRQTALAAYSHQDLPFEMLVETLQPDRDLSRSPLFQVALAWNPPVADLRLPGLEVEVLPQVSVTAKFELELTLSEAAEGGLSGALEYNSDLFERMTVERLLGSLEELLGGMAAQPEVRVGDLPLLGAAEQRRLLVEVNATAVEYPRDRCLHELFEAQVQRSPEATALVFDGEELSYQELNARANRLAHHLRALGVGPETRVGLCLERGFDMVAGLLGVLKTGGAYVPLDPEYPAERLNFMLADAQIRFLLTQQFQKNALPFHGAQIICLDTDWWHRSRNTQLDESTNLPNVATHDNLAYVIYTSGSTGKPKGSMITQRGLMNYVTWARRTYPVAQGPGAPVHSPLGFDLTVTSLLVPLVAGRAVHLLPEAHDVESLVQTLRTKGPFGLIKITPAHLEALRHLIPSTEASRCAQAFVIGGEALLPEQLAYWRQHAPHTSLINEYGPTETVVGCCIHEVPAQGPLRPQVPIGRPIANTQTYVLDEEFEPVPVGVEGELFIGGAGVARGYLNRPGLTAEKFVPDPFGEPGGRLYRTGDRVRWNSEGELEFLGRLDNQVKIRGFRIELGEIEAALSRHPGVAQSVVLAREDRPGDKRLVAYVVPRSETAQSSNALRDFLRESLPDYMLPAFFVFLPALPLTLNGKFDRNALPAPDDQESEGQTGTRRVPPRNAIEELLVRIWRDVLGVQRVGVHDNFFELGGHSLLAVKLLDAIHREFPEAEPVPLRRLFEYPTVAEIAQILSVVANAAPQSEQGDFPRALLQGDAELGDLVPRRLGPMEACLAPRHVFLTGATGFLGAYLLRDFLEQTGADLHCLVRAESVPDGLCRLEDALRRYPGFSECWRPRIRPVLGNLSEPFFGLTAAAWNDLANQVDVICHNGALVNFLFPYERLKGANVEGTRTALCLAVAGRIKTLLHISTVSVLDGHGTGEVGEDDRPPLTETLRGGYSQSKWVAERLVEQAGERGLPVAVFRPGRITGDSVTGAANTGDAFHLLLHGSLQAGVLPAAEGMLADAFDLTPVDYVSGAVLALSRRPESFNGCFHLLNPHRLSSSAVVQAARTAGFAVCEAPFVEWLEALRAYGVRSGNEALGVLLPEVRERAGLGSPTLRQVHTQEVLAETAVRCPPDSLALLKIYLAHLKCLR